MNTKAILLASFVLLSVGFLGGRYLAPPKEITKIEVEEKEVIRKDIQTIIKEVVRPDGTKETTTTTTDNSVEKKDRKSETLVQKQAEKQWLISAGASRASFTQQDTLYQVMAQRRVLGPVFAGVSVSTDKQVGLVLTAEF
jgi:hypothetical protein